MYAVIQTGGKQYRVAKNQVIKVEKLAGEAGDVLSFDRVMMIGDGDEAKVGAPFLDGAAVTATVLEQIRDDKIVVFKKKRRKNHRRTNGHRQHLTVVRVNDILAEAPKPKTRAKGTKKAAKAAPVEDAPAAETEKDGD